MRHTFSAEFLKVSPPATSFGEAWENLCLSLLRAEMSDPTIIKLAPPDRGIDLLHPGVKTAYQCKSNERGVFGTIDAEQCIDSLRRAVDAQKDIPWIHYSFALNAPLSGIGFGKILQFAALARIDTTSISFLTPDYWDDLCERHRAQIERFFDYRVFVSEAEVIEALRKARYYDEVVLRATEQLRATSLQLTVSNNRTPVELVLPFSGEMTIEQLLDVVKETLGLSLSWANFPDLGTSCGPSLSMTVDRTAQPFRLKLSELTEEQRAKLQLWIKLVWRDEVRKDGDPVDGTRLYLYHYDRSLSRLEEGRGVSRSDRGKVTLERMNVILQASIWKSLVGSERHR